MADFVHFIYLGFLRLCSSRTLIVPEDYLLLGTKMGVGIRVLFGLEILYVYRQWPLYLVFYVISVSFRLIVLEVALQP